MFVVAAFVIILDVVRVGLVVVDVAAPQVICLCYWGLSVKHWLSSHFSCMQLFPSTITTLRRMIITVTNGRNHFIVQGKMVNGHVGLLGNPGNDLHLNIRVQVVHHKPFGQTVMRRRKWKVHLHRKIPSHKFSIHLT